MTAQPLKACQVCWTQWCQPDARRCDACAGRTPNNMKRARPKLDITDFSGQNLDGLNINDFIDPAELQ
ncbi:MAG: hypothetical protein ACLP9Y_24870 [Mycobacterium sp.]